MPESLRVKIKKLHYQGVFNDSQKQRLLAALDVAEKGSDINVPAKIGHWVGIEYDGYADGNPVYCTWECSACGAMFSGEDFDFEYCPRCGAKMEVET